jgi:hypothetical protein
MSRVRRDLIVLVASVAVVAACAVVVANGRVGPAERAVSTPSTGCPAGCIGPWWSSSTWACW